MTSSSTARILMVLAIVIVSMCWAVPAPSDAELKRMLREIATNENAYGVVRVVPYSERLPGYMVIANDW